MPTVHYWGAAGEHHEPRAGVAGAGCGPADAVSVDEHPAPTARADGTMGGMFVIRATKKLLDRIKPATLEPSPVSTTVLGDWYATAVFWQPRVALFVNESTLLPILIPLAPAAGLPNRFPPYVAATLAAR